MRYVIFENGEQINTIVADEEFCADYCAANGYTYEVEPEPEPIPIPEPEETSVWDELDAAYREGVNTAYDQ